MEIRISVQHASRDLILEVDEDVTKISKTIADSMTKGDLLDLTDAKGRRVIVPTSKLAFIEFGIPSATKVGFN